MSGAMAPDSPARRTMRRPGIGAGIAASARGLAFCGLMLAATGLLLVLAAAAVLTGLGVGILIVGNGAPTGQRVLLGLLVTGAGLGIGWFGIPAALLALRRLAGPTRRLAWEWCDVPIAAAGYRPPPGGGKISVRRRYGWLLTDPATWRDLRWASFNACGGWVLAAAPAALVLTGLIEFIGPATRPSVMIPPPAFPGNSRPVLLFLGAALIALGLWTAPWLLRACGAVARAMLVPAGRTELALQVRHLAQTRAEAIDTGAAEMRRIERDLHDGAQARLVAMGMTLDAAGQILDSNPAAARALLLEARDASAKALAELRDLVRGIHPPVLADRGLADAVRALALDSPLSTHLDGDLAGRPPAPVESAAYFAVSELLANVSKHAAAAHGWIDIRHTGGMLRIGVTDDGRGGADPARGSGLRGIERRIAAFDGVLAVSSPPGGPTAVTMEIPCALSSPKTSSC
jgi:signal transduction histidine kinase